MIDRKTLIIFCVSGMLAGLSISVSSRNSVSFTNFDTNGDNKVSKQEFIDMASMPVRNSENIFVKLDINSDGYISQQEVNGKPRLTRRENK